jgi:hypothetical protein
MIKEMLKAGASVFLQTTTGPLDARVLDSSELGVLIATTVRTHEGDQERRRFFPWSQVQFIQLASD